MKKIIFYLFSLAFIFVVLLVIQPHPNFPSWITQYRLIILCCLMGGFGGIVYCLRSVYLNYCVKKQWDSSWHPWYYIRPIISLIIGGVSYLFLKLGLFILEAEQSADATNMGFLVLAFIAGYNVDKFIAKMEEIAQTKWGIEKSRNSDEK